MLHVALRNVKRDVATGKLVAANGPIFVDGKDVMPGVISVLEKMEAFTKKVQSGEWKGASGKRIKNIINVGIGGSDLGPKMAAEALKPFKAGDVDAYFISNIDGTAAAELMKKLDPEETLVIVVSKTFTTQETVQNAETLKQWVLDAYQGNKEVIKNHFAAVSTAKELVTKFGIDPENMFEFWDWVGGRYSVWSAVGLTLATYIGFDNFLAMLEGGREADDHFRTQPVEKNIPIIKALLNVWYSNFQGAETFAVLPYDQYLSLFPAFAQQFFMESNGKSVDRNGNFVNYKTGMIGWGSAGTDGQHSYYQLIHQGTHLIPADFIGIMRTHNPLPGHNDKLYSNFVAQTEALAFGATTEEVKAILDADPKNAGKDMTWLAMQKTFTGNKPTTSILIDQVTPKSLGNLIALYEQQIFTEGVIFNIFSFDQWGVQLGKIVATDKVLPFLDGTRPLSELTVAGLSPSAQKAIGRFAKANAIKAADKAMGATRVALTPTDKIRPVKFGTSGDRWVETDWDSKGINSADHINRVGTGIAEYFKKAYAGKIMLIAYDPRQRNKESAVELARLYAAHGIKTRIIKTESTPTPVAALLANHDDKIGGVTILTASHSPWTDRGIKFSPYHGGAAPQVVTDEIQALANQATEYLTTDYESAKKAGVIEEMSPEAVQRIYVDEYVVPKMKELGAWQDIVKYVRQNPNFEAVLDPMQGTGVRYLKAIYAAIAKDADRDFYTVINDNNTDVRFSNVNGEPNPTKEKSRAAFEAAVRGKIAEGKQVMGASVDADSDRFGNIDSNGEFIPTNDMIALIAYFLKKEIGLDGAIGKTVATSNFANAVAALLGMDIDEEPVGFKYFVDNVVSKGRKYLVAGEESSHVAVGPFVDSWDDGFVVGLMGLWITARTGMSLTQYKDAIQKALDQKFMIETITIRGKDDSIKDGLNAKILQTNVELKDGRALSDVSVVKVVESMQDQKVIDIITKDGVKLVLASGAWILLRPSGTEPAVKLYVEVATKYNASATETKEKFDQLVAIGNKVIDSAESVMEKTPAGYVDDEETTLTVDNAALNGGIDLNGNAMGLDVEKSGAGVKMNIDPAMAARFKSGDFTGLTPVILKVTPITSAAPLLGLEASPAEPQLVSAG